MKRKGIETGRRKGRERGGKWKVCEILRLASTPSLESGVLTLLNAGLGLRRSSGVRSIEGRPRRRKSLLPPAGE